MELNIRELNELIYCIGIARMHGQLLGTTVADSLDERLRAELDKRLEPDYITSESLLNKLKGAAERYSDEVRAKHNHIEESSFPHYVTNEEADENASTSYVPVKEKGWITQAMLDYVDNAGAATFTEMNEFYQFITGGSNSFTHILQSLKVPYKNRKTQRYLAKEGKRGSNAKWVVKIANPYNWVIVDDYDEFSNQ